MILTLVLRCVALLWASLCAACLCWACADMSLAVRPQASTAPIAAQATEPAAWRTVILVRHAEKDTSGDARDPHISEAGRKRARTLARLLGKAHITHLFASEFQRTQETLAPLADVVHVKVEVLGAAKSSDLGAALKKLPPQSVALVAGHSNTIPALARELGVVLAGLDARGNLDDAAYDRMFVLTLPPADAKAAPSVIELCYGD